MRMLTAAIAALVCTGCNPGGPAADAPSLGETPSPSAAQPEPTAAPMLAPGEYRIAGVDGRDIDQPYAITAAVSPNRIHVTADCLNFAWDYTARGDRIATERMAVEGCGRGPTAAEEALVAALDAATHVARTPGNAIELRGAGPAVTLFTQ